MNTVKILKRCSSRLSYEHCASMEPLLHQTVGERLRASAEVVPDRESFVFRHQNLRRTYEQLYQDSERLALGLLHLGLQKGDRVGMWGPNFYEWVTCQFATALAGLVMVNVNPSYQSRELVYALQKVGVRALITPSQSRRSDFLATLAEVAPEINTLHKGRGHVRCHELPTLEHIITFDPADRERKFHGAWNYDELLTAGGSRELKELHEVQNKISIDDPVNIQFTSGTTGFPKAATLTHHNIVNDAHFVGKRIKYDEKHEIVCIPNPLYHCFGCVSGSLASVLFQQTTILPYESFHAESALRAIEDEKATTIFGTPTMYIDMLNNEHFKKTDTKSLHAGLMTGAPCPEALCARLVREMNLNDLTILYGSTELSPFVCTTRLEDEPLHRIKNVGYLMPHLEASVVDGSNCIVPRGERGELKIRGWAVMREYWNDDEKTKKDVENRWYKTGDIAIMAEDGALAIVGRSKDMIIRGGENIYPTEIEKFLMFHTSIADVHVIGVPDHRMGEEICAWVRVKEGFNLNEEQIREYCQGKIAHFKIPRYFLFKQEADFPMTVTGKVKKFELREISKQELGLGLVQSHFNQ